MDSDKIMLFFIFLAVTSWTLTFAKNRTVKTDPNFADLTVQLNELKKEVQELKNLCLLTRDHEDVNRRGKLATLLGNGPGPNDVFFTAVTSQDMKGIAIGETIVYGNDFENRGGGYNNNTGIFTVPTSGVYLFSFFCNSLKSKTTNLAVYTDGYLKANCQVEPSFDGEDETGGNVFIARMNIGSRVWVEVQNSETTTADLKQNFNSFAGVLIHR